MPQFIIIAPPLINTIDDNFVGANKKSEMFNEVYKKLADKNNCLFIDNNGVTLGPDGVHLNENGHKNLAGKIYNLLIKLKKS